MSEKEHLNSPQDLNIKIKSDDSEKNQTLINVEKPWYKDLVFYLFLFVGILSYTFSFGRYSMEILGFIWPFTFLYLTEEISRNLLI